MNVSTSVPRWRIRATVDVLKQSLALLSFAYHPWLPMLILSAVVLMWSTRLDTVK